MPSPRKSERSHVPIVATWETDSANVENKSIDWTPTIFPSISAIWRALLVPSEHMNFLSSSSENGLSKAVYLPSAITEFMTSATCFASFTVACLITIFVGAAAALKDDCPSLSHWSFLALSVENFQFRQSVSFLRSRIRTSEFMGGTPIYGFAVTWPLRSACDENS